MKITKMPNEERPREKLLYYGREALNNGELIAILLRTGYRDKSALELANEILGVNEDGLRFLEECSVEELAEIKGMGKVKACQLLAAIELGKRVSTYPKKERASIGCPEDIADLVMEKMRYYKKEHFYAVLLDTKGKVIEENLISVGDLSSTLIHPREVFNRAVKRSAAAVVLVHNHPSGEPDPSAEDILTTERLVDAAEILGINIVDHIIIGDGVYTSLKTEGFM